MTISRTLTVAAACFAVFGASFLAGQAILDDADGTQQRPTRSPPPVDSAPPSDYSGLELALGRAADLPGLRMPRRPAKESPARAPAPAVPPAGAPQPVPPSPSTQSAPAPFSESPPMSTPAPRPPSPPRAQTPPVTSPRTRSAAPGPDAAPKPPQPSADPAPSGGAPYDGDDP
jgi:hypothetical protein